MIKKLVVIIVLSLAFIGTASADDFDDSLADYNAGNYKSAFAQPSPEEVAVHLSPEEVAAHKAEAEDGDAVQQYLMGYFYEDGVGVPEDYATAVKWYTKGAEQGNVDAQDALGLMYVRGKGVPEDNVMAYMWWNLAAAQGHESAKKNKDIVQERMTPADISKAQTLSRECLAKNYKNCG